MENFVISEKYKNKKGQILQLIDSFNSPENKDILGVPERNVIKKLQLDDEWITIKSFKIPTIINQFAYRYIRKSKAKRSFEFGEYLLKLGINNPEPIAYLERFNTIGLKDSYYISKYFDYDFTLREVDQIPDYENFLRQFIEFNFMTHNKGVFFKDNTPGNTLVKRRSTENKETSYEMQIVDLNRIEFKTLSFSLKMKTLARVVQEAKYFEIVYNEYSRLSGIPADKIKKEIQFHRKKWDKKLERKTKLKKFFRSLKHSN